MYQSVEYDKFLINPKKLGHTSYCACHILSTFVANTKKYGSDGGDDAPCGRKIRWFAAMLLCVLLYK